MQDEKVYPSETDEYRFVGSAKDEKNVRGLADEEAFEEPTSRKDEEVSNMIELKSYKKKALIELRCRVQDAILGNYLLDRKEISSSAGDGDGECIGEISLWGIPLLPSKGHGSTDVVLMKFLKAREYSAAEAFRLLQRTLKWRREFKVDQILDEEFDSELQNIGFVGGRDRKGRPICYNVYSLFNNKQSVKKRFDTKEKCFEFFRWRVQFLEKVLKLLDFKPGPDGVDSILQITDLKSTPGPAMKEIRWFTKKNVMLLQDNYPDLLYKNIVINSPLWYIAFHALNLRLLPPHNRRKFIFARPSRVAETLIKYIEPQNIPVQYGGLKRDKDEEFSSDDPIAELHVRGHAVGRIQIPVTEGGVTVLWDVAAVGAYEVEYKEEFVPDDDCSYRVLIHRDKHMEIGSSIRNSFHIREPGKILITIDNGIFKKTKVFYRYKFKPTVPFYALISSSSSSSSSTTT